MEQTKKPLPGAVLLLAALGFVLGTCEFVIVGILPEIAEGLNTSLAAVGKLVSVFAACYAVGTPVITAATGGIGVRRLLRGGDACDHCSYRRNFPPEAAGGADGGVPPHQRGKLCRS